MACNTEFNQEQFDAEFEAFERGGLVGFGVEDYEVEIDEVYNEDFTQSLILLIIKIKRII